MIPLLKRLLESLSPRRRKQLFWITGLMVLSALAEVVSLGLVIPFLGVLISPDKIMAIPIVAEIANAFGIISGQELLLPLTIAFVVISFLAGLIRMLQLWAGTRLTFAAGADLSLDIYRRTLYQPYHVHLSRNTSVVVSSVIDKVNQVAFWILLPMMTLLSSALLLIFITVTLIIISPWVACVSIFSFGICYAIITKLSKTKLRTNSDLIAFEQTHVVKILQEGLGGIRDVLLDGTQDLYTNEYHRADQPLRYAYGSNIFIAGFPRFAMEAFGIALISGLAYVLSQNPDGIATALPTLGALALGAQRLLPALQSGYTSWSSINGARATLVEVLGILEQEIPKELMLPKPEPLRFNDKIEFKAVDFRYSPETPLILNNFNLTIKKGQRIGFVGATGSGKSTTLDLLMGLLHSTSGQILVDGEPISGTRLRAWQSNIAHVPQTIYLADSTIAENIAFGIEKDKIDIEKVKLAARKAHIAEFIEGRPEGYKAFVGERGIRLSGGQRQRIGIARALYKQADVIVFDEATSALDSETESEVMKALEELSRSLTILIIAHRVSTLRLCDVIVSLKSGQALVENKEQVVKP